MLYFRQHLFFYEKKPAVDGVSYAIAANLFYKKRKTIPKSDASLLNIQQNKSK